MKTITIRVRDLDAELKVIKEHLRARLDQFSNVSGKFLQFKVAVSVLFCVAGLIASQTHNGVGAMMLATLLLAFAGWKALWASRRIFALMGLSAAVVSFVLPTPFVPLALTTIAGLGVVLAHAASRLARNANEEALMYWIEDGWYPDCVAYLEQCQQQGMEPVMLPKAVYTMTRNSREWQEWSAGRDRALDGIKFLLPSLPVRDTHIVAPLFVAGESKASADDSRPANLFRLSVGENNLPDLQNQCAVETQLGFDADDQSEQTHFAGASQISGAELARRLAARNQ